MLDLPSRPRRQRSVTVAVAGAAPGQIAQVLEGRRVRGQRKIREAIAEVLQREGQAQGQLAGALQRLRQIAEALGHLQPALEIALAVAGQQAPGAIEVGLLAYAREHIGHRAAAGAAVQRLVARHQRQPRLARQRDQPLQAALLRAIEMTLDLDEAVVPAEDSRQPIERAPRLLAIAPGDRRRQRTTSTAGETHQPAGIWCELIERDATSAFRRAQLHPRDQPAEIAIPVAILDQHRQPRPVRQRDLAADQGAKAGVLRRPMEPRRPIHAVAIHQRQRRHPCPRGRLNQSLRLLGALQERERRLRVQLNEHRARSRLCIRLRGAGRRRRGGGASRPRAWAAASTS